MKIFFKSVFALGMLLLVLTSYSWAQGDAKAQVSNIKTAIKAGSSKELVRFMADNVDINLNAQKTSYSRSQAEFVLKDFFKKYVVSDFQFVHQGESKDGHKYAIGTYKYEGGSFRVYLLLKSVKGTYLIDTLDFSKE